MKHYTINPCLLGIHPDHPLFSLLDGSPFFFSGRYPHRYVRIDLRYNPPLSSFLSHNGFWLWLSSNSGRFVYLHQILAFFFCGGIEALNHYRLSSPHRLFECHHINGNSLDNRPSNLVILSSKDHQIVTRHQRGCFRFLRVFKTDSPLHTPFNRRGRLIKDWPSWFANVLALTLWHTSQWVHRCPGYLKGILSWISRIVSRLRLGIDSTFVPNPPFCPSPSS